MKDGESIAITFLAKAYQELGHSVTLLAMNTTKHWCNVDALPDDFNHYKEIHTVRIDNRPRPMGALRSLMSGSSYHLDRFKSQEMEEKLVSLLKHTWFDVIQLETLYPALYLPIIRKYSNALVIMRAHNVEHEIWDRMAANGGFSLKNWYLRKIIPPLREFELSMLNRYDAVAGITERDIAYFRSLGLMKPALCVPIGIDCRNYMANAESYSKPLSLAFIGSLDWLPNLEGLEWFLKEVWMPFLHPLHPTLKLHIAGRNTPANLRNHKYPNVVIHGEVEDAKEFILEHSIFVVPLLSGSGMRAKILESMALGRVTVSTSVGLEGIDAQHKEEVIVANTPTDFVSAINYCLELPEEMLAIGQRAQVFSAKNYDNLEVAKKFLQELAKLKGKRAVTPI